MEKDEYDMQIAYLKRQFQPQIRYQTAGAHAEIKPGILLNLGVIAVSELCLAPKMQKIISDIISRQMNQGLSFQEFTASGGVVYQTAQVPWAIGAIAAIPITLIIILLFVLASKLWYRKRTKRNRKILEHESILKAKNLEIQSANQNIMEQIELLEEKKQSYCFY